MLLSPRSFRSKVNGSFYPPSSSGVGRSRQDQTNLRHSARCGPPHECCKLKRNLLKCLHLEDRMRTRIWYCCPFGARNSVDSPEPLGSASSDPPSLLSATLISQMTCAY